MKKNFVIIFLTLFFIFISVDSFSIPAFSRKYKTSCVTCHSAIPKLNPFGETFRYNGYKFPINDEENVKEEPLKLGAEAYKRVFPKAVWPNSIPATSPVSFRGRIAFVVDNQGDSILYSEFGRPALQLLVAGSIGENLALFFGAHLFENGEVGSIDRLFLRIGNILDNFIPERALNLRVGQFIPDIVPFASNHRGLTNSAYAFNTYAPELGSNFVAGHVHGGGPFGIENFQLGVEANGILKGRFRYVVGMVNGNGIEIDNNSFRDFYGRLGYKFGGLAYDGTYNTEEIKEYEVSFAFGIFGYKGIKTISSVDIDFNRFGFDANIYLGKFNLVGGYITGKDGPEDINKYNLYFAEANYMFYPWLTGLIRYEQANPNGQTSAKQIIPHISSLIVVNCRLKIETILDLNNIKFNNLFLGLDVTF